MDKTSNNQPTTSWFENIKLFKFKKALKSESVFEIENIHVSVILVFLFSKGPENAID